MRRSDPRIEASQRLMIMLGESSQEGAESRCVEGWSLNASRGGLRIIAETQLELGDEVMVRMGDDAPLRPGRVVWVQDEPDGCIAGIAYLDVPRDTATSEELDVPPSSKPQP